jgi:hypothetical protein
MVHKPRNGDALVISGRYELYHVLREERMWAAFDTYLIDATWVSQMSWKNYTDMMQTYTHSSTTGLTITGGGEVSNGFSLGSIYQWASVTINNVEKVFKPTETKEPRTTTINLSVPPRSILTFYQRRYRFRNSIFFILNAWGKDWNVGGWKSQETARKECEVEIMSEDYAIMQSPNQMAGTAIVDVNTVDSVRGANATKTWDECTTRCKSKLRAMYV